MFLPPIFGSSRTNDAGARRRRHRCGNRVCLEALENRTPLSTGFAFVSHALFIAPPTGSGPVAAGTLVAVDPFTASASAAGSPFVTVRLEGTISGNRAGIFSVRQSEISSVTIDPNLPLPSNLAGSNIIPPPVGTLATVQGDGDLTGDDESSRPDGLMDSAPPFSPPGPFYVMGLLFTDANVRPLAEPTAAGDSVVGPLVLDEATDGASLTTAADLAGGRSETDAFQFIVPGRSVALNPRIDSDQGAWTSYLAGGTGKGTLVDSRAVAGSDVAGLDAAADEVTSPAALLAGEAPIGLLLGDAAAPDRASSESQEQVAELVPLSESSLALAGTVWSVASDTSQAAETQDPAALAGFDQTGSPTDAPQATLFVIGLNESVKQSAVDLRAEVVAAGASSPTAASRAARATDRSRGPPRFCPRPGRSHRSPTEHRLEGSPGEFARQRLPRQSPPRL